MKPIYTLPLAALALISAPQAAFAQDTASESAADPAEVARLRAQVAALSAQLEAVTARLDALATQQTATQAEIAAMPAPVAPTVTADAPVEIAMGAAPEVESEDGFSFKPFGRLMLDAGVTSLPDGYSDGFGAEARRARLGVSGDIPGGFAYKMELDFAGNEVDITDALIEYGAGDIDITVGQFNNFQSMEELTSSRFTSFIERAAFTDAFGFARRLGIAAEYGSGDILLQAGVFHDNLADLDGSNRVSVDGRAAYFPKMGDTQLHFGGSLHYADLGEGNLLRYRQRPLVHFTDERPVNTDRFDGDSEFGAGLEFAAIRGPLHVAAEGYRQQVGGTVGQDDAVFHGGYLEAGLFLTPGDSRGYSGGRFNRTRPARPVGEGGIGAVQVNVRYDYLDLVDDLIVGGTQNGYLASLIWTTTDYTRLQINYGHLEYDRAQELPTGERDYSADVVGVRAEFDF